MTSRRDNVNVNVRLRIFGIMPYRRGHSDAMNIDANQMDASKIDATIYQLHNKRFYSCEFL